MKKLCNIIASASVLALIATPAQAVTARASASKLIEASPGKILSTTFNVSNPDAAQDFIENIQFPASWRLIMPADKFITLQKNQSINRILAILVPASTPSGVYTLTYEVTGRTDPGLKDRDSIKVSVASMSKIEMINISAPIEVINGREFNINVRMVNRGNVKADVKLVPESPSNYECEVTPQSTVIEPQSFASATITVRTDRVAQESFEHNLLIRAMDNGDPTGRTVLDEKTVTTIVTLNDAMTFDRFLRLPLNLTVSETGDVSQSAFSLALGGQGYLDEEGTKKLDVLYRGPDTASYSRLGQRDEFHLNYTSPDLTAQTGDNLYQLSPLTEKSFSARGAYAMASIGSFDAAALYGQTRFDAPPRQELGLQLRFRPKEGHYFGVQGLRKPDLYSDIVSVSGGFKKSEFEYGSVELGVSNNSVGTPHIDSSYRLEYASIVPNSEAKYYFETAYAGPAYGGYYTDQYFTFGSLIVPAGKGLASFSLRRSNTNLTLDPGRGSANDELQMTADMSIPYIFGTSLLVGYDDYRNKDRTVLASYDVNQRAVRLGLEKPFDKGSVQFISSFQNIENNLTGTSINGNNQYSLYANYSPNMNRSISAYGVFGKNINSATLDSTVSAGFNMTLKRGGFLSLDLGYAFDRLTAVSETQAVFGTLNVTMPNTNILSLGGRWQRSLQDSGGNTSFLATYSIDFGFPVGVRKNLGSLSGTIMDETAVSPEPVAGAVVRASTYKTTTDKFGRFSFPYLPEGLYSVWVEKESLGEGKITSKKLPMMEVKREANTDFAVAVVNTCSLAGVLKPATFAERIKDKNKNEVLISGEKKIDTKSDTASQEVKVAGLPLTITDGEDEIMVMTDENGSFEVTDLRPGNWIVTCASDFLPSNFRIEQGTNAAFLGPKEMRTLEVGLVPEIRAVKMIDSGSILTSSANLKLKVDRAKAYIAGRAKEVALAAKRPVEKKPVLAASVQNTVLQNKKADSWVYSVFVRGLVAVLDYVFDDTGQKSTAMAHKNGLPQDTALSDKAIQKIKEMEISKMSKNNTISMNETKKKRVISDIEPAPASSNGRISISEMKRKRLIGETLSQKRTM